MGDCVEALEDAMAPWDPFEASIVEAGQSVV